MFVSLFIKTIALFQLKQTNTKLNVIQKSIESAPDYRTIKATQQEAVAFFRSRIPIVFRFAMDNKIVILLALLQWLMILIGCLIISIAIFTAHLHTCYFVHENMSMFHLSVIVLGIPITGVILALTFMAFTMGYISACIMLIRLSEHKKNNLSFFVICKKVNHQLSSIWLTASLMNFRKMDQVINRRIIGLMSEKNYLNWHIMKGLIIAGIMDDKNLEKSCSAALKIFSEHYQVFSKLYYAYILLFWLIVFPLFLLLVYVQWIYFSDYQYGIESPLGFFIILSIPLLLAMTVNRLFIRPIYWTTLLDLYIKYR